MFLILTAETDPARSPLLRSLARPLSELGETRTVGVGPSALHWKDGAPEEAPAEREERAERLRALLREGPKLVLLTDADALGALLSCGVSCAAPCILALGDARADLLRAPDGEERAHAARELWVLRGGEALPSALRARCRRSRGSVWPAGWVRARVRALLATAVRPSVRYPLTSLVIPVHDALPQLRACVESIRRNTGAPYELLLVDNGSSPATVRWLRRQKGLRVVFNRTNTGFAHAVNQGMRAARGRFVAWINSDLVLTPGWLERMLDALQSDPALGAVGPYTDRTVGLQVVAGAEGLEGKALDLFASAWALQHGGRRREAHRLVGFCVLLKKRAVDAVGLLDERFGVGCYEDFDYCLRLRQAGFKLAVAEDVFIRHHHHASFRGDRGFYEHALRNRELFIRKWCAQALEFWDYIDPELAFVSVPKKR
ncbi:MAG: glycosyltransferase family 2 protein [Elusimicrobiota bacterium]|jgi:GT2 family glycosyltransferase